MKNHNGTTYQQYLENLPKDYRKTVYETTEKWVGTAFRTKQHKLNWDQHRKTFERCQNLPDPSHDHETPISELTKHFTHEAARRGITDDQKRAAREILCRFHLWYDEILAATPSLTLKQVLAKTDTSDDSVVTSVTTALKLCGFDQPTNPWLAEHQA